MKIIFKTKKLEKTFLDKNIHKNYGESAQKAKLYLQRLTVATNLEEIRNLSGKLHTLKGDRNDQFAYHLKGPYRLVFEPCLPCNSENRDFSNWSWITEVKILEVVDYHD